MCAADFVFVGTFARLQQSKCNQSGQWPLAADSACGLSTAKVRLLMINLRTGGPGWQKTWQYCKTVGLTNSACVFCDRAGGYCIDTVDWARKQRQTGKNPPAPPRLFPLGASSHQIWALLPAVRAHRGFCAPRRARLQRGEPSPLGGKQMSQVFSAATPSPPPPHHLPPPVSDGPSLDTGRLSCLYNTLFYPDPSFEMLRGAQQEQAPRLGSEASLTHICAGARVFSGWCMKRLLTIMVSIDLCPIPLGCLLTLPASPPHHPDKRHVLLCCAKRVPAANQPPFLRCICLCPPSVSHSDNRSHPARGGSMGEADAGPLHLPDSGQLHQCPLCPHWHRHRHHCVWPVWMLCHLQRKPVDAEAGERLPKALPGGL